MWPIAVGLTLRRLVSKVANSLLMESCVPILAPRQLGVGVKSGAEALVHAARRFLGGMSAGQIFVKLDFSNAFNTLRRDSLLEAVFHCAPGLLPYASSAYGGPSILWLGDGTMSSAEGVQQGDPLGPLLFCLAVNGLLQPIKSEFVSGYLDDVGMGGGVDTVIREILRFQEASLRLGLVLNHSKCEVIGLSGSTRSSWALAGLGFQEVSVQSATLLGSPLHVSGVSCAVEELLKALRVAVPRLALMSPHEALFLIKKLSLDPQTPVFASHRTLLLHTWPGGF